jgi:hypothetical protein
VDTTVLRGGPSDVIAYAFYQLGYRPRESLILIGMHGPRLRTGLVVRVDLPPPDLIVEQVRHDLEVLRRAGEDAVMVLVVSDVRPEHPQAGDPQRRVVKALVRTIRRAGWHLQDVVAVGDSTWRSLLCDDPLCCPPGGRPLSQVTASTAAATMVALGRVLAPDEGALVSDVDVPAAHAAMSAGTTTGTTTAAVTDDTTAATEITPASPSEVEERRGIAPSTQAETPPTNPMDRTDDVPSLDVPARADEALERWRQLLHRAAVHPDRLGDVAWLGRALQDRWLRDAALLTLVPGSGTAPEELLAGADDGSLTGLFDERPDHELLEHGRVLLSAVARTAPPGERVDALALLAWMSWWAGDGARGRLLAGRALADGPGHRLAGLVDALLRLGVPPTWVPGSP